MLQLAQQYQAAADSLAHDAVNYGRGLAHYKKQSVRQHIERLPYYLLKGQYVVLDTITNIGIDHSTPPAVADALRALYASAELPAAAFQLIAAACEDMQADFKAKSQRQQQLKKKKKKKHKQQQQQQQQPEQQLGSVPLNPLLLELVVPADHGGLGLPTVWKEGVDCFVVWKVEISKKAYTLRLAHGALWNHLHYSCSYGEAATAQQKQQQEVGLLNSPVCCLGGKKLLLEAALLLQGVEPEAGVHHELQHLLNTVIELAPKEHAINLLRRRGGLIMEAARLTAPEQWIFESEHKAIPLEEQEARGDGNRPAGVRFFDWVATLNALTKRLGEAGMGFGECGGMHRDGLVAESNVKVGGKWHGS